MTTRDLPGLLNLSTGALFDRVWWQGVRTDVNAFRTSLGLAPHRRPLATVAAAAGVLELQAYSPTLVPGLADYGPLRPLVGCPSPPSSQRHALGDLPAGQHVIDPTLYGWLGDGQPLPARPGRRRRRGSRTRSGSDLGCLSPDARSRISWRTSSQCQRHSKGGDAPS